MKLSEFIGKVKEVITGHWAQGRLHNMNGDHCLLGALETVEGRYSDTSYPKSFTVNMEGAAKLMREIIEGHTAWKRRAGNKMGKSVGIAAFNDDRSTAFEDIEALLTEAERRATLLEGE